MSYPSRFLVVAVVVALGCCALPACGGASESDDADAGSGGQAGGSGGAAGKVGKGGSAGAGATSCEFEGNTYADGESFPAGDGCNNCSCASGQVVCTAKGCGDVCTELVSTYADALDQARTCDPSLPGQCSEFVFVGLQCGCESFVNPQYLDALATAEAARAEYIAEACGGEVFCGQCLPPLSSYCSAEGRCVDVYENGPGASCQVDGQVYASGAADVPDPFSCNLCTCTDGHLDCDTADCPEACPPDTVVGTQCALCGNDTGTCEVIEHACLPACGSGLPCQEGACIGGVCKALCG